MSWLQDHEWVVGVIVAAALALAAGLGWWAAQRPPPATPVPGAAARRQADLAFAAAVLITLAIGLAAVLWLLRQADQAPAGKERATLRAEAVKTGATIVLGTGGAAYLLLAYRRQRLEEVDTRERRITELYSKAVEQLGHEKAPVRLGALYSLERLAQDNPEHRQTVIDVVCAYLRMPYALPAPSDPDAGQVKQAVPPAEDGVPAAHPMPGQDPAHEELQVRQTAQRILATHLRFPPGDLGATAQRRRPSVRQAFWPGISLDLTGAALIDFNFASVSVRQALFGRASFQGNADFRGASFQGNVGFDGASFQGDALFRGASFQGNVGFNKAIFQGTASFFEAAFRGYAWFEEASFQGNAGFREATFQGNAGFRRASFQGNAGFREATFQGNAGFRRASFQGNVEFTGATLRGNAGFDGAHVLRLDDLDLDMQRVWPDGFTVRPDPADHSRGTLVPAEHG
jgi:hypothetical protein